MSTQHLGIDDEDFCMDMIPKIETSFGFHFEQHDLEHVSTFGELCQVVLAKIPGQNVLDCTTQQAFYRIREAFKTQLPTVAITPSTRLAHLLPTGSHKRRKTVAAVEAELGVKLNVLGSAPITKITGLLLLLGFGATMFFDRQIGGMGLAFTFAFFYFASKLASTIQIENVRDVVELMTSRHYQHFRRNSATINRAETIGRLQHLFSEDFGLELAKLTPDALLI